MRDFDKEIGKGTQDALDAFTDAMTGGDIEAFDAMAGKLLTHLDACKRRDKFHVVAEEDDEA